MSRPVRLRDIAQYLGISVSTVSLALRESTQIAEETRERVIDAAQQLGYTYRQRPVGRVIGRIAYLTNLEPDNIFSSAVLSGVESACRKLKIALDFSRIDDDLAGVAERYGDAGGLLLMGNMGRTTVVQLQELGLPMVLVDNNLPTLGLDRVLTENVGGIYRAVEYLYGLGHRRIAFLNLTRPFTSLPERLIGYQKGIADFNLEALVISSPTVQVSDISAALAQARAGGMAYTAIIAANDLTAISVLHALQDAGVCVPDDISLIGFDDLELAAVMRPALTTCRVHRELMGALGVQRLIERATQPDAPPLALVLDAPLIERQSVRAVG
jgi:DNA-binding LacI/PurR family transcriptional regulator